MNNKRKKKKKKKKNIFKSFMLFILYEIIFILLTSPFVLFYGPFNNLKKAVVYSVQASQHRYMLSWILPKSYLDSFSSTASATTVDQDMSKVKISNNSEDISVAELKDNNRFDAYIMKIGRPKRIKVAMTKYLNTRGQKTSEMAKEHNAVAAINGGTFSDSTGGKYAATGATPGGFVISDGKVIFKDVSESDKLPVTAFTTNGKLIVGQHSINDLMSKDVSEAVTFRGTPLIVDGKGQITDQAADGYSPRTAVGQTSDGTVLFLVVDGRKSLSKLGASLYDLQQIFQNYGVVNASNLDGGDSATMYYEGKIRNSPNVWSGERSVATAFVVEQ
ncbi:MAG: phosphodiester glycosidase family protein [Bacillota bacterium]|nr:phosphodiester glycosidase family protein [Bacillota bacterium]